MALPPELQNLLDTAELPELGPQARTGVQSTAALESRLQEFFTRNKLPPKSQQLMLALMLLWHDHLDAAHTLAQEVETADGSFVHAIMHRREPDAGNSKYWWHRVGAHACFSEIGTRVMVLLKARSKTTLAARLVPNGFWSPMAFVDVCTSASPDDPLLREIQKIETEVLLEHLLRPE